MKKRALISVWDKTRIVEFSRLLLERGFEILSTGGTQSLLEKNNLKVTPVSDLTDFGAIMDGRVKTLHPKIFGGILADRNNKSHMSDLDSINSGEIDIVVVNLYPFVDEAVKNNLPIDKAIEFIDIGGPSMLRAAAKNHASVIPICDSDDYDKFIGHYDDNNGDISIDIRKKYATKVFQITSNYDYSISNYLGASDDIVNRLPDNININVSKDVDLRYGENPHQSASFYISNKNKKFWNQLQGKKLSYNNYTDIESALSIVQDFKRPSCSIIKHANPCGFSIGSDISEAFDRAVSCDPVSYFGGIVGFNRMVDSEVAEKISKPFLECIVAPDYSEDSLSILKKKKNLRLIKIHSEYTDAQFSIKDALGGYLLQNKDNALLDFKIVEIPTAIKPDDKTLNAMKLGWRLVKYVKSNAIVFADENQLLGIGAGQMSRVDSVKNAIRKVQESGLSLGGATMASDAFFPFPDSIEIAAKAGISSVIQPGGSIKDSEVVKIADELNLSMVLTKIRHFYH